VRAGLDELRDLFVRLVSIRSPSREERAMADAVIDYVHGLGLDVREDDTAAVTGCACGNLVVRVPGRGRGTPIALSAHIDTVPLARAPAVIVENGVVRTDGETVLGGDDKAAVTAILMALRDLAADPPAAAVEVVFSAGEEIGLQGAKAFDVGSLAAEVVFVLDSEGPPGTAIVGGPTLKAVEAEFRGTAAHAGIEPEAGRSAVVAAARAIAAMDLGRLDDETTANVGIVRGGTAVNVVPERCAVRAEARSRDEDKLAVQVGKMVEALSVAAAETGVDLDIDVHEEFRGYAHDDGSPQLRMAAAAVAEAGLAWRPVGGGGGSDANVFNLKGRPAVNLAVGFEHVHSPQESMSLLHLQQTYELVHALVRVAGESRS
jgi:tripeptide aminopeptidase